MVHRKTKKSKKNFKRFLWFDQIYQTTVQLINVISNLHTDQIKPSTENGSYPDVRIGYSTVTVFVSISN